MAISTIENFAMTAECERCGKCCHQLSATMTLQDMNREPRLWEVAVPIHRVGNRKTRRFMLEKGHPFVIGKEKQGGPCPFLTTDNLCLIYETRPQICRDYPQGAKCVR